MKLLKRLGLAAAGAVASVGSALAAVPTEVTSSLTDAKSDGIAVAGVVLAVIIGIGAFKYIRKAL